MLVNCVIWNSIENPNGSSTHDKGKDRYIIKELSQSIVKMNYPTVRK